MPDCLVCGKPTTATHMGMDACRACTVFFRRNRASRDKLQCINGTRNCKDYRKGIYTCRKCRLDRFDAVMAAGRTEEQQAKEELSNITPSPSSSTQSGSPIEMPDQLNFDFNTAMQGTSAEIFTPPQTPSHSIIEKIRSNYRTLSIMRRTAEFQMRGIFLDPFEADKEEYEVIPCTYQMMNEATRILITGLFDFIPALFPEFEALSVADKWLLIRNYQKIFHCLDSCFRMHRRWGIEKGLCFGSYTTYLSEDTVDVYFSDCTDQKNVSDAARTLRDCIQENCVKMKKQISRVQPTEDEYLALMGIAFWSVENAEPNENLMNLAARYRTEILSDLKARYKQTIGEEEGTIRIGGLYCLLLAVKKAEMNMKWEYEVYRILNVFDDNTYMYKLQLHRPDIES